MSIFSDEFNPMPWLQEKTLLALQASVDLVDLANEPDTTGWYKRKLLRVAELLITRLAPVVAYLYQTNAAAADRQEWGAMLEGGSFALAGWCKRWKIADPHDMAKGAIRHLRSVDEEEEKAEELPSDTFDGNLDQAMDLKLQIYGYMSRRLIYGELTPESQRLLLWMMGGLWVSDPPDVVSISKRFLPTDIGLTPQQASEAYRLLYEHGLVERVDKAIDEEHSNHLSVRLIVQGLNDSRHAPEYREEKFGYPGARIRGQVTSGQGKFITLPKTLSSMLGRWFKEAQELTELRDYLQTEVGEDRAYVERAEVKFVDKENAPMLIVYFRYPFDEDDIYLKTLEDHLSNLAQQWVKEWLATKVAVSNSLPEPV